MVIGAMLLVVSVLNGFSAVEKPSASLKPTAPVDTSLAFESKQLKPKTPAALRFDITPLTPIANVTVKFEMIGVSRMDPHCAEEDLGNLPAGQKRSLRRSVTLSEPGKTEIKVWVKSMGPKGEIVFNQSTSLFVIVRDGEVLAGRGSFEAIEIAELKRRRDAHEITESEYQRRTDALVGGKSQETIKVIPGRAPTSAP